MHELLEQIVSYLKGIWRRKWYAMLVAWVLSIGGWIGVHFLPDRFEASARVYVDTQSVLKPLMAGLAVQPNTDQQIAMMTRTLISRPNLEKVVRMSDLDIKTKSQTEMDALVNHLSEQIQLKGTGQDNLYTISYQNKDPDVAKRVVQSLLTIFVESSLGNKRKDTDSAIKFIEEQLKAYEQKLVLGENALKEFKRKHFGMMPGQDGGYFERLSSTGNDLNQAKLALREAENRRDELKRQLAGEEPMMLSDVPVSANSAIDGRIESMQKQLDNLRLAYTEVHPDIVSIKRTIENLEEQKRQEAKAKKASPSAERNRSAFYQELSISLAEAEANVASLKARVAEYENRYNSMRAAINAVPQVEADYTQLNRDYEINKSNYEQLLSRREAAQISEDMESKAGVLDFRIIDPPRVPSVSAGPNRPFLYTVVLIFSIAAGIGLAFVISQFKRTIDGRKGLKEFTDLPLLGTISMVWNVQQKFRHKLSMVAFGVTCVALFSAYGLLLTWSLMYSGHAA